MSDNPNHLLWRERTYVHFPETDIHPYNSDVYWGPLEDAGMVLKPSLRAIPSVWSDGAHMA